MQKLGWIITLFIFFVLVGGCAGSFEGEKWHFHGYIIDVEDDQILLVEGISKRQISRKSVEQLIESSTAAIWLSTKDIEQTYEIGDKVYVWTTGQIETSLPAHGTATKIKIARWN